MRVQHRMKIGNNKVLRLRKFCYLSFSKGVAHYKLD